MIIRIFLLSLYITFFNITILIANANTDFLYTKQPLSVRAIMIHPRTTQQLDFYKYLINLSAQNKFNIIFIESTGWIHYPNLNTINLPNAFTTTQMTDLVKYAQLQNMEVIPYIHLLSHQEEVVKRYQAELMLNERDSDPNNPKTWEFEKKLIDDTITMYHPKKMLIGHDELWGYGNSDKIKQALKSGNKRVSPKEYVDHIIKVHNYLQGKGIQTMIWGDMFLTPDYSLGVYPIDRSKPSPGYNDNGEFVKLLDELPKDIIICDWHYENQSELYPSYDFFQKHGFTVWGASWHESHNIKTFTDYVRSKARVDEGMIATTWQFSDIKYKDYVTRIIKESGENFYGK